MNELLDQLDARFDSLMEEVRSLRRENAQLRQDLAGKTGSLAQENEALQKALAQERDTRENAAQRIDALLRRVTDRMPE